MITSLLSLLLVSCGTVKMNSFTNLNQDGSGNFKFQILYDDVIAKYMGSNFINPEDVKKYDFESTKYVKDNYNVEEISYNFNNLTDIYTVLENQQYATVTLNKKSGLSQNEFTLNITFNKPIIDSLSNQLSSDADTINYVKDIVLTNQITVPGKILNTNATDKMEDNSAIWSFKLGQIDENTKLSITYATDGLMKSNYILICIVSIITIIILVFVFLRRKK